MCLNVDISIQAHECCADYTSRWHDDKVEPDVSAD